jgi:hypothetical protein
MKALTTTAAILTAAASFAAAALAAPTTGMSPRGLAAYGQTLQAEAAAYQHRHLHRQAR